MAERDTHTDSSMSQTVKAQLALRELVIQGRLKQGDRVSELQLVELLGVSRTPARMALVRLQEEGLVEAIPSGGFAVRSFSERDVFEAVEIRGTLEGLAARLCAERGCQPSDLQALKRCVAELDAVVGRDSLGEDDISGYVELNARFHDLLAVATGSRTMARELARACALPFASPSALVLVQARSPDSHHLLIVAQDQHRCVVDAIERREGARAEAIMREHARLGHRNLERAFANQRMLELVPGSKLIARRRG